MRIFTRNPHSLPRGQYGGNGKRLFLGLMGATCFLLCSVILILWIIPSIGLSAIHESLPYLFGFLSAALIFCVTWVCVALGYHVYTGKPVLGIRRIRGLVVKLIFPLMELLGRALRISRERVRLSFVKVNNEMVLSAKHKVAPHEILLLLPHCLQNGKCKHRLTYSVDHCECCGLCTIGELRKLQDAWGFHMVIATGGTIARRIVVQRKPKLILAVACERDLTSGIQDTYPIPVFGIINDRPHGPCMDTLVNVSLLEDALQLFTVTRPCNEQ